MLKKMKSLKLAPWWKRLLSYTFDQIFLFIVLIGFISGIYGEELTQLLKNITEVGGLSVLQQGGFSQFPIDDFKALTTEQQNATVWLQTVQNKYALSVWILYTIISVAYYGVLWGGTGQTLGAKIFKIRVIALGGLRLPLISTILRVLTLKIIEMGYGIPALIIINPIFKQRIHDHISRTAVIEDFDIEGTLKEFEKEQAEADSI